MREETRHRLQSVEWQAGFLREFLKRLPLLIEVLVDVVGGLNALAGVIENSLRLYRP